MSSQEIKLQIDDQAREILETRGIRDEDIEMVVSNAEQKGEKLYREDRYLAKLKIEERTFYVEYSVVEEGRRIAKISNLTEDLSKIIGLLGLPYEKYYF